MAHADRSQSIAMLTQSPEWRVPQVSLQRQGRAAQSMRRPQEHRATDDDNYDTFNGLAWISLGNTPVDQRTMEVDCWRFDLIRAICLLFTLLVCLRRAVVTSAKPPPACDRELRRGCPVPAQPAIRTRERPVRRLADVPAPPRRPKPE